MASDPKKKKLRTRSQVWDHFDLNGGDCTCKYCPTTYKKSSGTGNMLHHLQIKNQHVLKVNKKHKVSYTIFHFKRCPRNYNFLFSQYNEEVSQTF